MQTHIRRILGLVLCGLLLLVPATSEASAPKTIVIDGDDFRVLNTHIDANTLVVLDLDSTTFRATTSLGSCQWFWHLVENGVKQGKDKYTSVNEGYHDFVPTQRFTTVEPCQACLPELINEWKAKACGVIALTARQAILAPATIDSLNSINIDFGQNPWSDNTFTFTTKYPVAFYQGVIFAHDCNKKDIVLAQFLDQIDNKITKIVFADDRGYNVTHVHDFALERGLEYIGLRFSGEDSAFSHFRMEIADYQLKYMDKVIPDAIAARILTMPQAVSLLAKYKDPILHPSRIDSTLTGGSHSKPPQLTSHDVPIEIRESTQITDLLSLADEKTLVVFDLNDTLMRTDSALGGDVWADKVTKDAMAAGLSKEQVLDRLVPFWHQVLIRTPVRPVEPNTANVLQTLQQRGVKTMGLTARYIEMAHTTLKALRDIFIDFSRSDVATEDFTLFTVSPAKYIDGVVFAGLQNDKADVLVQFLAQHPVEFDRIIFIDDKKKNVEGMAKAAKALNKPYIGIWYRAVEATPSQDNPDVAKIQQVLFRQIIPDDIVKQLL